MTGPEQLVLVVLWLTGAVVALGVLGLTLYAEVARRRRASTSTQWQCNTLRGSAVHCKLTPGATPDTAPPTP